MKPIRTGRLRHKITIQKYTSTKQTNGSYEEGWADVATVWAAIEPAKGKENVEADQVQAEQTHNVTIRYRSGIDSAMRVKFGTKYFRMVAPPINFDEMDRYLRLPCLETDVDN